jgi:dienelactone hydrolase
VLNERAGDHNQTGGIDAASQAAERAALDELGDQGGDSEVAPDRGSGPAPEGHEPSDGTESAAGTGAPGVPALVAPSSDQWHPDRDAPVLPARPNEDGQSPTILVAHGNAGCLPDHDEFCAFLADHGFNVLLFDYRGYGRSDLPKRGLNRADLVVDTRAAFEYLLTRDDVDPDRIGLLGYSLGGNIGLGFTVGEDRIRAVVTLATFSRWQDVAGDHGGPLGRFLIGPGMDAADSVASLGARPYLIVHGDDDDIVPHRHAAILEEAARDAGVPVTRLDVPGADHLDMTEGQGVQRAIAEFFARAMR